MVPNMNVFNDVYMRAAAFGATEIMYHNRAFISIGAYPFLRVPNNPEMFYPF